MTPRDSKPRSLVGKRLIIAGIVLFALWAYYFVPLVRPRDIWDFCPLVVALAVILSGAKLAGFDELILANVAISYKRALVIGLVTGALAELILFTFHVDHLPDRGNRIATAIYWHLRPHLGSL
jgi:hypothetical protein